MVSTAGVFTVTVTDNNGCTGTVSTQISESTIAPPSIIGNLNFCQGNTTSLSLGTNFNSYLWTDGSTNPTISVSQSGNVGVTVTDANGCTAESSVNVTANQTPTPTIAGSTTFCQGTSTTLDPGTCLLYTSPSPRDATLSRMPSSA